MNKLGENVPEWIVKHEYEEYMKKEMERLTGKSYWEVEWEWNLVKEFERLDE